MLIVSLQEEPLAKKQGFCCHLFCFVFPACLSHFMDFY